MKVVAITGATSGVGEELVKHFISQNWKVAGLARNVDKLKELEKTLGNNFIGLPTDIRNYEQVKRSFQVIKNLHKSLDILINNAAVFKLDKFINHTKENIDSILDTNLKGTIYCSHTATKIMLKNTNFCRIINIASVAGLHGIENQSIYCASKYGLRGFADVLNQELKNSNISLTTIFPGGINTPLWNEDSNPYPGKNKELILKTNDIVDIIKYIINLKDNIVLKEITLFTTNEWH